MQKKTKFLIIIVFIQYSIFVYFCNPSIGWFDSAEIATAGFVLGNSHPPGQALHAQISKIITFIPIGSISWRINLISVLSNVAVFIFISLFILYLWQYIYKNSEKIILFLIIFSVSFIPFILPFFMQGIRTEVYSISTLLIFITLFVIINPDIKTYTKIFLAGLIPSLNFSIHLQLGILNLFAGIITFLFFSLDYFKKDKIKQIILFICGIIAGLIPWLYLPLRAGSIFSWGLPNNFGNFRDIVTIREYQMNIGNEPQMFFSSITNLLEYIIKLYNPYILLILVLFCLFNFIDINKIHFKNLSKTFVYFLIIFLSLLIGSTGTRHLFLINPDIQGKITPAVIVFFIFIIFLSLSGLYILIQKLAEVTKKQCFKNIILFTSAIVLICASYSKNFITLIENRFQRTNWFADENAFFSIATIPHDSLVLAASDHLTFPLLYLQKVELIQSQIPVIWTGVSGSKWYLDYLNKNHKELKLPYADRSIKIEEDPRWNIYQKVVYSIIKNNKCCYKILSETPGSIIPGYSKEYISTFWPWFGYENKLFRDKDPTDFIWRKNYGDTINKRIRGFQILIYVNYFINTGDWRSAGEKIAPYLSLNKSIMEEVRKLPDNEPFYTPPGPAELTDEFIINENTPVRILSDLVLRNGNLDASMNILKNFGDWENDPSTFVMVLELQDHLNPEKSETLSYEFLNRFHSPIIEKGFLWLIMRRLADRDLNGALPWARKIVINGQDCEILQQAQKIPPFSVMTVFANQIENSINKNCDN